MQIFMITFVVFLIAVAAMAVGVVFSKRAIKGSCGGVSGLQGFENHSCSCKNPCENRKKALQDQA